jgi:hypothetical protein
MTEPSPIQESPPDRLSTDPRSPHYVVSAHERGIGISFNGKERTDVDEYCISEGWIRVAAGKTVDRKGKPLLIKLKGRVTAYFREDPTAAAEAAAKSTD